MNANYGDKHRNSAATNGRPPRGFWSDKHSMVRQTQPFAWRLYSTSCGTETLSHVSVHGDSFSYHARRPFLLVRGDNFSYHAMETISRKYQPTNTNKHLWDTKSNTYEHHDINTQKLKISHTLRVKWMSGVKAAHRVIGISTRSCALGGASRPVPSTRL